jgi:hypothetical protein
MKLKTFKDILNTFEQNDFKAFEALMLRERELMQSAAMATADSQLQHKSSASSLRKSPPTLPKFAMPVVSSTLVSPGRATATGDYHDTRNILGSTKVVNNPRSSIFGVHTSRHSTDHQQMQTDTSSRQVQSVFKGGRS